MTCPRRKDVSRVQPRMKKRERAYMTKVFAQGATRQQCTIFAQLLVCPHMVLEDIDGGVYERDGQGPEGFCAVSVLACGHGDESVVERGGL